MLDFCFVWLRWLLLIWWFFVDVVVLFHKGNGRCTFDIVLRGREPEDTTTGQALAGAAARLMDECVRHGDGRGGIVSGVGASPSLSPPPLFYTSLHPIPCD